VDHELRWEDVCAIVAYNEGRVLHAIHAMQCHDDDGYSVLTVWYCNSC